MASSTSTSSSSGTTDKLSPRIKIRHNLGSKWLGRCRWTSADPKTTTIELQRSILDDPQTLERVFAHEMVHHANFLDLGPVDLAVIQLGIKPEGHGKEFLDLAARINAVMGPGFVSKESDQSYVVDRHGKEFFILVGPYSHASTRLGFAWSARLTPEGKERAKREIARGARLFRITDSRWAIGKAKIRRFGGLSIPHQGTPEERDLRILYETGKPVVI